MTRTRFARLLLVLALTGLALPALSQPVSAADFELTIISPTSSVYHSPAVPLSWSANQEVDWIGYTMDGGDLVAIAGNATITGLSNGSHVLTITANSTSGSNATYDIAFDVLDQSPPAIEHSRLYQAYAGSSFTIGADVLDDFVVKAATVYYKFPGNDSYSQCPMIFCNTCGGVYKAIIQASLIKADTFYYYINATDGVNFAFSPAADYETNPYSVSIVPRPVKPPAVALSNASYISESSASLSWTKSGAINFTSYKIYQSTSRGITGTVIVTISDSSTTSYMVTGLSQNSTYYFTVRTYNNQSQYADSNQIMVTTTVASPFGLLTYAVIIVVAAVIGIVYYLARVGKLRRGDPKVKAK